MKVKSKKAILAISTIGVVLAPIATSISCGSNKDSIVILSGKSQIQTQGERFAKTFDNMDVGKIENAPSQTKFRTANGDNFNTTLATSINTKQFPSAMTLANATEAMTYVNYDFLLKFKNPKYDSQGAETINGAEKYNKKLAGNKINELIKAVQLSSNPKFMVSGDMIIGIPTYTESIGVIYNKEVFKNKGITKVIYDAKPQSGVNNSIFSGPSSSITVNSTKNTLYVDDLTSSNFKKLKSWFKSGGVNAVGASVSGTQSWAFTSKVGMAATIGWAAKLAGLNSGNVHMPGDNPSITDLSPDTAQSKLFNGSTTINSSGQIGGSNAKGFEVYKDALELYINGSKAYPTKQGMSDAFTAGQIAMMPGGSWMEGYLSKGGFNDFGMLPLSMLTDATNKPFIAKGISGYWQFSNQEKANKRSGSKAIAAQTKAVNFVWAQYLSDNGKNILKNEMGLLNPYDSSPSAGPKAEAHPLLATTQSIRSVSSWGLAANKPGVGDTGFERNNPEYTDLLSKYQKNPSGTTLSTLLKKVKAIWNK